MPPNPGVYSGPEPGAMDQSSGPVVRQHIEVATPSQAPRIDSSTNNSLSKPVVKVDNFESMATSQPVSAEDLTYDQEINPTISKFLTTDDYTDDEAGHRRTRFRAKVFTTIPPDPHPYQLTIDIVKQR